MYRRGRGTGALAVGDGSGGGQKPVDGGGDFLFADDVFVRNLDTKFS